MKIGQFLKAAGEKIVANKLGVAVGGVTAAVGTAGIIDPKLLEYIPESMRGYAVLAVVGVLCFKAVKDEIIDIVHAIKYDDEAKGPKA